MARAESPTLEMLGPGSRIDRYTLERPAGAGGGGLVFVARDDEGHRVGLKIVASRDELVRARFEREAIALQKLSHPSIVRYVAHGVDRNLPWLAMEWIEGRDLKERLADGPLGVDETLALGARLADALIAAHDAGVLHRDLKPANVMLEDDRLDRARLVDFGVARDAAAQDLSLTRTGMMVGTPSYMSPEQAAGEKTIDGRADLFALGALLWQCLTGRVAFEGSEPMVVLAQLLTVDPPAASSLAPGVPAHLDRLLAQLLAKDPAKRPPDALAVRAAIELLRPTTEPPEQTPRTSRRLSVAAPPAIVWGILCDTDRWNRLVGSGLTTYTHEDPHAPRVGHGAMAGIPVTWREVGEWVEGRFGWGERRFDDGPLVASVFHFECTAREDGGTDVFVEAWPTPSPTAPSAAGAMLAQHFDKRLARYVEAVEAFVNEVGPIAPPAADEAAVRVVTRLLRRASDRALIGSTRATDRDALAKRGDALASGPGRDALLAWLADAPDDALRVVRPDDVAATLALPLDDATRLLVDGTRAGLLDLRFELVCPTCRVAAQVLDDVGGLGAQASCHECHRDFAIDLDQNVDVVFAVHEAVRDVPPEIWCAGAPRWRPHVISQLRPEPGVARELPIDLPDAPVVVRLAGYEPAAELRARGLEVVIDFVDGEPSVKVSALDEPVLRLRHDGDRRVPDLQIERVGGGDELTLREALAVPELAQLLGGSARASLGRATLAVLVAQVDALDALCASEGDANAFEIVRERLDVAEEKVRDHDGAVLRRGPDRLLACFSREEDAHEVRASLEGTLRVGVAHGPVLVVRERDGVALFGGTVARAGG
ncbi:MAG: protein kinase [Myxococcales bacterium]|nr:protein kinase [Myxococcales bacterium]